jgi:hypothetical protein
MQKLNIIILIISFILLSCKKNKNDNNNLFLLLLLNTTQSISFSGKFGGLTSSLTKENKALPEGITDVLAISAANHYHRSKVDVNGNFSLGLVKGFPYLLVFIDSSNNVKGYYKIDNLSLSAIPTHYAGNQISGGEIEKTSSTNSFSPVRNFNTSDFITQTGNLSGGEIDSIVTLGSQMLNLLNIDTDGNGVIDLEEKLYLRLGFGQSWGGDISDTRFKFPNAQNKFFDISFFNSVFTGVSFGITIDKAKVLDKNVKITFPIPTGCTSQSGGSITSQFGDSDSGLASANDGLQGFKMGSQIYTPLGTFNCNGTTRNLLESGTYTIENSGKTYTYKNTTPFYISTDKTFILPTVKFNTSGNIIESIEYKYKKLTPSGLIDATVREVNLVYGDSIYYRTSGIICRDTNGDSLPWLFSCTFPKSIETGTITKCESGSNVKVSSPKGVNITSINNCNVYTYDAYGSYLGIDLRQ